MFTALSGNMSYLGLTKLSQLVVHLLNFHTTISQLISLSKEKEDEIQLVKVSLNNIGEGVFNLINFSQKEFLLFTLSYM